MQYASCHDRKLDKQNIKTWTQPYLSRVNESHQYVLFVSLKSYGVDNMHWSSDNLKKSTSIEFKLKQKSMMA